MVVVLVNEQIRALLAEAHAEDEAVCRTTKHVQTVHHKAVASALRNSNNKRAAAAAAAAQSLAAVLATSQLYVTHEHACAVHIARERNAQLQARVERLQARAKDAEYARMVRDVARGDARNWEEREAARMSRFAPQMSLGVNVLVTMATCFTAGYYVFKHSTGSQTGALIGGVGAMIVAMAVEVILLLTRMYTIDKQEHAHVKRRQRRADGAALQPHQQ